MGDFYRKFYKTTSAGAQELHDAINDPVHGAENRADVEKRLKELKAIPDDRCHVSRDQRIFLERVLGVK